MPLKIKFREGWVTRNFLLEGELMFKKGLEMFQKRGLDKSLEKETIPIKCNMNYLNLVKPISFTLYL